VLEALSYPFMARALVASVVIGVTCSFIGVFVVLRGLSFIGAGVAHAGFAGVALAFLIGWNPVFLGVVSALAMVLAVGGVSQRGELKLDAAIGILFSTTMALAILFIGLMRQYNVELFSYLFGNVLAVTNEDLYIVAAVSGGVILILLAFFKEFQFICFNASMAEASGLPVSGLFRLLLVLIALTIVVSLKAVGELLVIALIVIPAAAAFQLTHFLRQMIALAVLIGAGASAGGVFVSFYVDVSSGSSVVLLLAAIFALATALSPKKKCRARPRCY